MSVQLYLVHAITLAERRAEDERAAREKPVQAPLDATASVRAPRRPILVELLRRLVLAPQAG
jgi:hypothetical protein